LSTEDIKLFEDGKLDPKNASLTEDESLLVPYDKAFEIPKSSLVVRKKKSVISKSIT